MKPITVAIPVERFDALARKACQYVFSVMIDERARFTKESTLIGSEAGGKDLFGGIEEFQSGCVTVAMGYVGSAKGLVTISLPTALAEVITVKLVDPSSDAEMKEMLLDVMGEFGNSFASLVKGGLGKYFPDLVLTPPKVLSKAHLEIGDKGLGFRKQYLFEVARYPVLVNFCHDQPLVEVCYL